MKSRILTNHVAIALLCFSLSGLAYAGEGDDEGGGGVKESPTNTAAPSLTLDEHLLGDTAHADLPKDLEEKDGEEHLGPPVEVVTNLTATTTSPVDKPVNSASAAVPAHSREEQFQKLAEERRVALKHKHDTALFNRTDKAPMNLVLNNIMQIMESKKDGTAKITLAAIYLKDLIEIKNNIPLGEREEELLKLHKATHHAIRETKKSPTFPITDDQIKHEINTLKLTKFYPAAAISLLEDYYLKKVGFLKSYGGKVGGALLLGAEAGAYAGFKVTATGKRYPVICPTIAGVVGLGPIIDAGKLKGNTDLKTGRIHLATAGVGIPVDTFLYNGDSASTATSEGTEVQLKETVFVAGVRAASMGLTNALKISPYPIRGRDFRYLRDRLGLNP